jgi:predicted DsbA family dithiol-disulfide isomerase
VLLAYRCAIASPHVLATAVEASEFPERADRAGVQGVPAIAVDERLAWAGRVPEGIFVERLLAAAGAPAPGPRPEPADPA